MRNPDRIDKMCEKIAKYWKSVPDWRLGQLLVNATRGSHHYPDLFYIEDNELEMRLDSLFND